MYCQWKERGKKTSSNTHKHTKTQRAHTQTCSRKEDERCKNKDGKWNKGKGGSTALWKMRGRG